MLINCEKIHRKYNQLELRDVQHITWKDSPLYSNVTVCWTVTSSVGAADPLVHLV